MFPVLALLMVQSLVTTAFPVQQGTRRAIIGAAVAAAAQRTTPAAHARYTEAAINAAASVGIKGKEATKAAPIEIEMNAAEKKLQVLVAETVAKQEKDLGFKFDDADVKETEKILRNKCGACLHLQCTPYVADIPRSA